MGDFAWLLEKLSDPLVLFGLAGQFVFMLRFVVQWLATERRGRSHVPLAFWYLSLGGGLMLFVYGWLDRDPVILLGQSLGLGIYARNIWLIQVRHARFRKRRALQPAPLAHGDALRPAAADVRLAASGAGPARAQGSLPDGAPPLSDPALRR